MSWLFSQALVEAFSEANSLDGAPFAPSSGTPMPPAFLWRGKTTDAWSRFPSGMMCEPLTESRGEELLTWFREGFPAKTFQLQAVEPASMGSVAECGGKWRESLAKWNPATSSWKTHQLSFLEGLESFSGTWPRWGMMRNGECWELSTQAPRTSATGSGLWLTPCATDAKPITGGNLYQTKTGTVRHMRPDGKSSNRGLNAQVMWPPPNCPNGGRSVKHVTDWRGRTAYHNGKKVQVGLEAAVKMWVTPRASANENRQTKPTPSQLAGTHGKSLCAEVGGALNPTWVEWLMGWPLEWTDCAASATDKFRQWCASHGIS